MITTHYYIDFYYVLLHTAHLGSKLDLSLGPMTQTTWIGSTLAKHFCRVELIGPILISQILANTMAKSADTIFQYEKPIHYWSDASFNRVTVKIWSGYLQYLQNYLETLIHHLASAVAAVSVLEADNKSPDCRYIIEIWYVLMACTWK